MMKSKKSKAVQPADIKPEEPAKTEKPKKYLFPGQKRPITREQWLDSSSN
jgi:hypothetical protein